jgi:hypothetical protein
LQRARQLQQGIGNARLGQLRAANLIQRQATRVGERVQHPAGIRSPYRRVAALFNGSRFVVVADGAVILDVSAGSGKPVTVRPGDARACAGRQDDSYLNNPRYVGVRDYGAIPEGSYSFRVTEMSTFSTAERLRILAGGQYVDPFGRPMHGGDWGAGRVPLGPTSLRPSRHCGDTRRRSGFYLHGGIMPGSSGCIDIGNAGFERLVGLLLGYRGVVPVRVDYTGHTAPEVGAIERAAGRFTYPETEGAEPTVWDRFRSLLDI